MRTVHQEISDFQCFSSIQAKVGLMYQFSGHQVGVAETKVVFLITLSVDAPKQRAVFTVKVIQFSSNAC